MAAPSRAPRRAWSERPQWQRSLVEVGVPVAIVAIVAVAAFGSGGGSRRVAGGLSYDRRARPLLVSLEAMRGGHLKPGERIAGAGGCNGSRAVWTCDLQIRGAGGAATRETYNVRWNQTGCWGAIEDCVNPVASERRLCPPPTVISLSGCITAAQAAA